MKRDHLITGARLGLAVLWVCGLGLNVLAAVQRGAVAANWIEGTGVQALALGCGAIGFLLTVRRRNHLVGWLLLCFAASFAVRLGIEEWAVWQTRVDPTFDAPAAVVAINLTAVVMAVPLLILAAVFPHDHLPRGRGGAWMTAAVGVTLLGLVSAPISGYETSGIVFPPPVTGYAAAADALAFASFLPLPVMIAILPIRLGRLLRRGNRIERLQIRWLLFVLAVVIVLLAVTPLVPGSNRVAGLVAGVGVPIGIWIAISRHGLYEIDRIISRTVSYAVVAAVLAGVFAAGAIALPQMLPENTSNVAVAGTTLAAAALFNPLRRRVFATVEQRFHRLPYVADRVIERLTRSLRGEVRPAAVLDEFVMTTSRALSPVSISVWIAESRNDSGTAYV